ncbi:GPI mannosyltransferase 2 [Coccinella septempunctata]|uniref:GPI mannosyltransferase 2 n=1 Tax=Coccinella septempunctata TaxID=41139 RepID=UPI001D0860EB|nr:GPI mannosyltransferase 2 [Coccinella septempunctata]
MSKLYRKSIIKTALFSRLLVIFLQYIFNHLITDHDAGVFLYPRDNVTESFMDKAVSHFFGGFLRWDAQYFMHIAKYGYTYENTVAFFPLFPLLGNSLAKCLSFIHFLSEDSLILLVFMIVNLLVFVQTALILFDLSRKFHSEKFSYYSAILFCWNPASVFFSSPYTECIFSCLTFWSMLNCIVLYEKYAYFRRRIEPQDLLYLLPIALGTITRSNGVLNLGFYLYILACMFLRIFIQIKGAFLFSIIKKFFLFLSFLMLIFLGMILCLSPFHAFQLFSYNLFCKDFTVNLPIQVETYAKENNFVLLGTYSKHNQSWCNSRLPMAYSYVQKHYWNVGLFSYYEFKQIPNFLLAAPILIIFIVNCRKYIKVNFPKNVIDIFNLDISPPRTHLIFENPHIYVFIIHGLILSIFCILFVHIQVSTRFLCSSSPLLYWFSAYYMMDDDKFCDMTDFKMFSTKKKYILSYYLTYFLVGIALFCNFLPWT